MKLELVIAVFEDENKASGVLQGLKHMEGQWEITLGHAATLVRRTEGQVTVKETHDWDPQHGAILGMLVGGVPGAAMGPVGALIGATMAGAAGGVIGSMVDMGFPNSYLSQVHDILPRGHSALVVLVRTKWLARLLTELSQQGGQIAHWTLESDFEPALEATLNGVKAEFDSLLPKDAMMRAASIVKLEAELAALKERIALAGVQLEKAQGLAQQQVHLRLYALRTNLATLLAKMQALAEDDLQSLRLAIRTLRAEALIARLEGRTLSSQEIEFVELQKDCVLQKLEANLKAQADVVEARLESLRDEGAPESMWARAHWDRQVMGLEEECGTVLEQRRLNLVAQRGALDRAIRRRKAEANGPDGALRREHESKLEAMSDRRGELLQKLARTSVEGTGP